MAQNTHPTAFAEKLVRLMRQRIRSSEGINIAPTVHRIPVQIAANSPPRIFTIDLEADDRGTFLVSCRELSEMLAYGKDEEAALVAADLAIEDALLVRRCSAVFPY